MSMKKYVSNEGCEFELVEYINNINCIIRFIESNTIKKVNYQHILSGNVKNPYYKSVCGIGYIGEGKYKSKHNKKLTKEYSVWRSMIERCYSEKLKNKYPTYKDCLVEESWHNFQNFAEWHEKNYKEGFHLDKDILVKGNKIYSFKTCCFVPVEINSLLTKTNSKRGSLPIGVSKSGNKFKARLNSSLLGTFNTPKKAFQVYKKAKEQHIKEVAKIWKGKITKQVYKALMSYKVEITD